MSSLLKYVMGLLVKLVFCYSVWIKYMICDRRVSTKVKGKVYRMVVTSHDVWFGDASNRQKTIGRAGGGRAKDAEIVI